MESTILCVCEKRPVIYPSTGLCDACSKRKSRNGGLLPTTPARPKAPNTFPLTLEGRRARYAQDIQDPVKREVIQKRCRAYKLRTKYNLTPEDYERMFIEQDGKCVLCHQPPRGKTTLVVDHNHETNQVRKLLCVPCNRTLGYMENSIWAATALDYLDTHVAAHHSIPYEIR